MFFTRPRQLGRWSPSDDTLESRLVRVVTTVYRDRLFFPVVWRLEGLPSVTDPLQQAAITGGSDIFVGHWHKLVSTTNWEKGKIIQQWRETLAEQGLPVTAYSDEAWSRLVGGISSQHVGRLRRVYERFGPAHDQFPALFWSHFSQALEWDDAEMWLEGAVQNGWSVAETRQQRSATLGLLEGDAADAAPELAEEPDEEAYWDGETSFAPSETTDETSAEFSEETEEDDGTEAENFASVSGPEDRAPESQMPARPFESLPSIPDDLGEALEELKLTIVRHRLAEWREVSPDDLLAHLDALRALVLAPPAD